MTASKDKKEGLSEKISKTYRFTIWLLKHVGRAVGSMILKEKNKHKVKITMHSKSYVE